MTGKEIAFGLAVPVICFTIYEIVFSPHRIATWMSRRNRPPVFGVHPYVVSRIAGFGMFFFAPAAVAALLFDRPLARFGLSFNRFATSLVWSAVMAAFLVGVNFVLVRRPAILLRYPQIRAAAWTPRLRIMSGASWGLYLFGYEFLFRGVLLFSCARAWGFWTAVAVNVVLYVLVHVPKGRPETAGAVPFGFILAVLTLKTGTIWAAVFSHLALALSMEWLALRRHLELGSVRAARPS